MHVHTHTEVHRYETDIISHPKNNSMFQEDGDMLQPAEMS